MKPPSIWAHFRDIILLPGNVVGVIPYFISHAHKTIIPHYLFIRVSGVVLFVAGFLLFTTSVSLFRNKGFGTLASWSSPKKLVVTGPYLYCRNPMITGVVLMLTGEGSFFWSAAILVWAASFFIAYNGYTYFFEEPGLVKHFGEEYVRYKKQVPRWIPRLRPYEMLSK